MKKFLFICLFTLLLVGCKKEIKCSLEKEETDYKLKQEITLFSNKDNIVTSAETTLTMTFESEEAAQEYYSIFGQLEQKSDLKIEKNQLIMKDTEEYNDNSNVDIVKEQLQGSGYSCN